MQIQKDILLSDFTTIRLGGKAKYFCQCMHEEEIIECLEFARKEKLKVQILGGGSNIVFSDKGFNGLVIKIVLKGMSVFGKGESNDVEITSKAGEDWDSFMLFCVSEGFSGLECLSGIPGNVGAAPIQNIGAYGHEVNETIVDVTAIDKNTFVKRTFSNKECKFGYRKSRFKNEDRDRYIITEIRFKLSRNSDPKIKYPELIDYLSKNYFLNAEVKSDSLLKELKNPVEKLKIVRNAVLEIRKRKSMVIDSKDPDSVSCGSFFVNPVISEENYKNLELKYREKEKNYGLFEIPHYITKEGIKVPAAWLIEKAGFYKGYKKGGTGISSKHTLALVNKGGTAKDILNLAKQIEVKVYKMFGIKLEKEPLII